MVIDEYKDEAEKCNLLTVYEALKKVSLLQSGSDFVELEKINQVKKFHRIYMQMRCANRLLMI